jgi:hypothetical protein
MIQQAIKIERRFYKIRELGDFTIAFFSALCITEKYSLEDIEDLMNDDELFENIMKTNKEFGIITPKTDF